MGVFREICLSSPVQEIFVRVESVELPYRVSPGAREMKQEYKKKSVIVTGADNGIGLAMTRELLSSGRYLVGALDLSDDSLSVLQKDCPERLRICICDVTDGDAVGAAVESLASEWGRIDILLNNACLAVFGRFEEKAVNDSRREFEVNYWGAVNLIRAVLPHMKSARKGVIHNVSSGVGITGFPGIYGYASSKGALEALTRTLALELKEFGIVVNLMHPPLTRTRSSSPLGIPEQAMDNPERVGRRLARKIGSRRPVITPDFRTGAGLLLSRHFPVFMGRMLAWMTERARKE